MISYQCGSSSLNNSDNVGIYCSKWVMTLPLVATVLHKFVKPLHNFLQIYPSTIIPICCVDLHYGPPTHKLCWKYDLTF